MIDSGDGLNTSKSRKKGENALNQPENYSKGKPEGKREKTELSIFISEMRWDDVKSWTD